MPLIDLINFWLRDHEGHSGDVQGGVGELPVGDRSTAKRPIWKRDLRYLLGQVANELASVMGGVYPAAGVAPATSFAAATDTGGALYLLIGGRLYEHDFSGPFESGDGRRWRPSTPSSDTSRPLLVLATGQSNMLGHTEFTGGERRTINGQVYIWEGFPGAGQTEGWKVAGPDSPDWPFLPTGNSIAYHFCDMLQRQTGRPVYLVMQAAGGQPIAEWLPGGGGVAGATGVMWGTLNGALEGARAATLPTGGTLAQYGIEAADMLLWHQGEADADYRGTTAAQYLGRFRSAIATMRDPASAGSSADPLIQTYAPVIMGELLWGGMSGGQPTDSRNAEFATLDREEPLVTVASSRNLTSGDNLHFTGLALQEFARRYFERLGTFPKRLPTVPAPGAVHINGKMATLWGNGITVNAGTTSTVTLPVPLMDANYVPRITLTNHGSSSPYMPLVQNRTQATFQIVNPGASNLTVAWEITYRTP